MPVTWSLQAEHFCTALLTFFGILNATGKLFVFPGTASWIYNGGWISYPRGTRFTFLIYLSGSLWRILNYPVTRLAKRVLACIIMALGSIERGYLRSNQSFFRSSLHVTFGACPGIINELSFGVITRAWCTSYNLALPRTTKSCIWYYTTSPLCTTVWLNLLADQ